MCVLCQRQRMCSCFFFSSRRRHTRCSRDWSSDVCSSDLGWNLLGTAHYRPDIGIVDARFAWYLAVIAIVLGHVVAVAVGHTVALREYATRRAATRSQLPMLVLMVGYTMMSLWIIAQPIVEASSGAAAAPASFIGAADDTRDLPRSLARKENAT